jgi:hypothetical protein
MFCGNGLSLLFSDAWFFSGASLFSGDNARLAGETLTERHSLRVLL